jgi:amino acid transporter
MPRAIRLPRVNSGTENLPRARPGPVERILAVVLGRTLANREQNARKIGALEGVPAMGLDGLGSSAYGPEAALTVLMPLGAVGLTWMGWIMAPIVVLLLLLFASYWHTIRAYPNNGGAYIVAKENLGVNASLLAAAALMVDYVLNVAVGISAGVGALVSAVPTLQAHIRPLCLGILLLITTVNLRGTLDAGRLFALPTYTFVGSFALILGAGLFEAVISGGHPRALVPPPALPTATETISVWLLMRAFASGCTAMTGVEAVSNGMTAFRDPPVKYGHRTLSAIVIILGVLLAGVTYLAGSYGIGAMDQTKAGYRSVLAQLAGAVIGNGPQYYVAIGSLLCVLALSANTSFVDFPRLCRTVAADGFLPKSFTIAGRRLVYSVSILFLASASGGLLFAFGGITDHLIPLFAIGAFLTFTLSQAGMALHWRRARQRPANVSVPGSGRGHQWINTVGALTTGAALLVIVVAKFKAGAWITIAVIPAVIALLKAIRRYYDRLARSVDDAPPLRIGDPRPPIALLVVSGWNKLTAMALETALAMSREVIAIHLYQLGGPDETEHGQALRGNWLSYVETPLRAAGVAPPRLVILRAPRRAIHEPLLEYVRELDAANGGRHIAVLIPELVRRRWYEHVLHTRRTRQLRARLLDSGVPRLVVVDVPWYWEG